MVAERRYCVDGLQQLAAVQEGLRSRDAEEARAVSDERMRVVFTCSK